MSAKQLVERVYVAFEALDFDTIYALIDEDIVYQNMAQQPVYGREALRTMWNSFGEIQSLRFDILNVLAEGEIVLSERVDHMVIGGHPISIPAAASITVRDGKIIAWREYFDMATMEEQLGVAHPGRDREAQQ